MTLEAEAELAPLKRRGRVWSALSRATPFSVVSLLVVFGLAFIALYPLSRVFLRLFYVDGELDLSAFREVFEQDDLVTVLRNTAVVVVASSILGLMVGGLLAWLNERTDARLGIATDSLPLVPFLLPPIAGAIGWVLLLSARSGYINSLIRWALELINVSISSAPIAEGPFNIYSWWGLIFVYTIYQVPYAFLLVSAGLRNLDPSLEEQSRICGYGLLQTLRKVTLPGILPSAGAAVLLMIWFGFALFSVPVILGTGADIEVLSVRIVRLLTAEFPAQTALAVGNSIFVVLVLGTAWYFQARLLRKGRHATVGGKGYRATRIRLGVWRKPARLFMFGYVFVAAVLPLIALVLVSLRGFWSSSIEWGELGFDSIHRALFDDVRTRNALLNSLRLSSVGATIGIVAAAMLALFVQRSGRGAARLVDAAVKFPATISTIVIAVGFTLAFTGPPFNLQGTLWILLLAYLAIYMPQGSVAADAAASQVGDELTDASAICGAGGTRTFLRVSLPIMLPGLVAGWALLFVRMTGDLTASAILAGTGNNVVGFRILEVFEGGSFALLASLALALTVVTSTVLVILLTLSRRAAAYAIESPGG
jgi:iron(III) transport system permease protein